MNLRKIKNATIISCIALVAFVLSSCNEDSVKPIESEKNLNLPTIVANNALNPYDSIGICHNLILAHFANNVTNMDTLSEDATMLEQEINYQILNFNVTHPNYVGGVPTSPTTISNLVAAGIQCTDTSITSLETMVGNLDISDYARVYIVSMFEVFEEVLTNTCTYTEASDFSTMTNEIIAIENNVINNPALSAQDKQVVLTITSVTRHSLSYWVTEYFENTTTPWVNMANTFMVSSTKSNIALMSNDDMEVTGVWGRILGIAAIACATVGNACPAAKVACIVLADAAGAVNSMDDDPNASAGDVIVGAAATSALASVPFW